ncbi:MAG: hypothetical protein V9G13_01190 [Marmoricola sp.]
MRPALVLVMAAAGVGLWSTPAAAAACAPGQGVSVVLDHKDVPGGSGKGVVVDCVRDGAGRSARAVFKSAGDFNARHHQISWIGLSGRWIAQPQPSLCDGATWLMPSGASTGRMGAMASGSSPALGSMA